MFPKEKLFNLFFVFFFLFFSPSQFVSENFKETQLTRFFVFLFFFIHLKKNGKRKRKEKYKKI